MASPHLICRTGGVLTGQSYDLRTVWHSNQRSMCGRRRGRLKVVAERPCKSNSNSELPNMANIMKVGSAQNVQVQVKSWGPVFEVRAISMVTGEEIGRANGFITLWFGRKGKILHLESIRMTRQAFTMHNTSIFGMGLLVGAVAIRHGFDCNCKTAELLAINDSSLYHSKLVRFYTRMGFKAVHEVKGASLADIIHMLAWGGIGTRMDADIEELLTKWSYKFKPRISDVDV